MQLHKSGTCQNVMNVLWWPEVKISEGNAKYLTECSGILSKLEDVDSIISDGLRQPSIQSSHHQQKRTQFALRHTGLDVKPIGFKSSPVCLVDFIFRARSYRFEKMKSPTLLCWKPSTSSADQTLPIVVTSRRDDTLRLCVIYKRHNRATIHDLYPFQLRLST